MEKNDFQTPSFLRPRVENDPNGAERGRNLTEKDLKQLIHPLDATAINTVRAVPGFSEAVGFAAAQTVEKMLFNEKMADALRLGPKQLSEIYNLLPPICEKFGIKEIPDLFVDLAALPNAYTFGDQKKFITITSGMLDSFSKEEIQLVLAHECGHILCRHSLYTMISSVLGYGLSWLPFKISDALRLPFYCWERMSELSADRAMLLFAGNVDKASRVLVRLACGGASVSRNVNMEAYREQTIEYEGRIRDAKVESAMQTVLVAYKSHPFLATRIEELTKWKDSAAFAYLSSALGTLDRRCPECGAPLKGTSRLCENGHFC